MAIPLPLIVFCGCYVISMIIRLILYSPEVPPGTSGLNLRMNAEKIIVSIKGNFFGLRSYGWCTYPILCVPISFTGGGGSWSG